MVVCDKKLINRKGDGRKLLINQNFQNGNEADIGLTDKKPVKRC